MKKKTKKSGKSDLSHELFVAASIVMQLKEKGHSLVEIVQISSLMTSLATTALAKDAVASTKEALHDCAD